MKTNKTLKVMSIFGTRPEAIKMCPLILEMEENPLIESVVCLTGQHKEMLKQVMDVFPVTVKYHLDIMQPRQTLTAITASILNAVDHVLDTEQPDLILVHGDTTTSFTAALAAFYKKIPVGHVEAGLRTYDKYSPYPEEMNRNLTSKIAELHFCPTEKNKANLLLENISTNIFVTGNTVIDAFQTTVKPAYQFKNATLKTIDINKSNCVLITVHRRENIGQPLVNICQAIKKLAEKYTNLSFVYPLHLNPAVQEIVTRELANISNVYLIEPLDVEDMHNIINRSFFVMTDSGGLQEEAPSCGVPVLVVRSETERPEAVQAGTVKVIGTNTQDIITQATSLIEDNSVYDAMSKAANPYGDGHASERIIEAILRWYFND